MKFARPVDFRLWGHASLICLPAVLLTVSGVFLLLDKIPDVERSERTRIRSEYRTYADDLLQEPERAIYVGARPKGSAVYHQRGRRWGVVPFDGAQLVWIASPTNGTPSRQAGVKRGRVSERVIGIRAPTIEATDYRTLFSLALGLALGLVFLLTGICLHYFIRYARDRDDLLSATAHDLTTPLVGMRFMIGRDDAEARVLNERMIRLVSNIKDFLRLGGRRPPPQPVPFDLLQAFAEAYALFASDYRDLSDGKDIPLDCRAFPDGRVPVCADETLVVQILWNLLGNDLKYAAPDGPVSVVFGRSKTFVTVSFVDQGKGLSPRQMTHIFDRYYRAKSARASGKGGFGIGLSTSREFARAMGGDLVVTANRPKGCIFTLKLPLAPAASALGATVRGGLVLRN